MYDSRGNSVCMPLHVQSIRPVKYRDVHSVLDLPCLRTLLYLSPTYLKSGNLKDDDRCRTLQRMDCRLVMPVIHRLL